MLLIKYVCVVMKYDYLAHKLHRFDGTSFLGGELSTSVGHSVRIKVGKLLEDTTFDLISESGKYQKILKQKSINIKKFGGRSTHKADIIAISDNNIAYLFNVKSETVSHTEDPSSTVKLYINAKNAYESAINLKCEYVFCDIIIAILKIHILRIMQLEFLLMI